MIDTSDAYERFQVIFDEFGVDDSVVDGKLVDTQAFQTSPLIAAEGDPGRKNRDHALAYFAHRSVDGVDEAAPKVDHPSHQIGIGSAQIEQDGNPIANAVGQDLGVTKLLDNEDVGLNVDCSHGPDG
jgi:hypothetical protein